MKRELSIDLYELGKEACDVWVGACVWKLLGKGLEKGEFDGNNLGEFKEQKEYKLGWSGVTEGEGERGQVKKESRDQIMLDFETILRVMGHWSICNRNV